MLLGLFFALAFATTYFKDDFSDGEAWSKRWVQSTHKPADERGSLTLEAGKWATDVEAEKGIHTGENARFYHYSTTFPEFTNKDKTLVFQYTVKNEQTVDCGGMYLKLHPAGFDQTSYNGDTKYNVMFGPDFCGSTRRCHLIFNNREKNHLIKNDISPESDTFTHTYRLVLKPDNSFDVTVDGVSKASGQLEDNFDMLPPKKINDPTKSKPADWVDNPQMDDPEDKKPEGWDDIKEEIVDPDATKPADWDDELDGEWAAPTIRNPEYKGKWSPKRIDNPLYKGPWEHPQIDNPEYKPDNTLYQYASFGGVGLEVWQVTAGTTFDNILVTDSVEEADAAYEKFKGRKDQESALHKAEEEERSKKLEAEADKERTDIKEDEAEDDDKEKAEL